MKVFVVIVCLAVLANADAQPERPDCKIGATPEFKLAYGEAFAIQEACLLLKCRGGNNFEVVSNCPTVFRGAPADVAAQKSREMGDKILAGQACEASSVI
ncbi:hypothetical protein QE152_g29028 [Popillia japonica]|uniref:Uncharacterized protein n=1 Tax=Popillia japonica TaxID=7064 RepID=A0AAW1JIZ6_POPJA